MAGVVGGGLNTDVELVFTSGFDQTIKTLEGQGEIAFAGLGDEDMDGQVVAGAGVEVLIKGVAKVVAFAVGIPSPVGRGIAVEAVALAGEDAKLAALAGGFTGGGSARRQGGAIATEQPGLGVTE